MLRDNQFETTCTSELNIDANFINQFFGIGAIDFRINPILVNSPYPEKVLLLTIK